MNNSPHHLKHQQRKAIRKAQKEETYQTDPSHISEKQKKTYLSKPEKVKQQEGKAASQHRHHMTSPEEVTWKTEPQHIHLEGKHWIKTIRKKVVNAAARFQKKLQKFGFFKRKG
ncbi:MAG: hypothetical protein HYZ47_01635 [Simkania negevensis]|nr:hypothetical protein [Simkania negevensis]